MNRRRFTDRVLLLYLVILAGYVAVGVRLVANVFDYTSFCSDDAGKWTADSTAAVAVLAVPYDDFSHTAHLDSLPGNCQRLKVDRSLNHHRIFNDSNYLHLRAARQLGIHPAEEVSEMLLHPNYPVRIHSTPAYFIDTLRHSLPYLVPAAEQLLSDIGSAFRDSLQARGGGDYRIKVTSVLRTASTVNRLRRRNGNAVSTSAHLYATTFDISHSNFICDNDSVSRTVDDLKFLLAEVLQQFRDQGRCYVKHERKQSCFHITLRSLPQ